MRVSIKGNSNGFTLIELTVTIAIIVILTALLLPTVARYVSDADSATGNANAKTIYNAAVQVAATNVSTPGKISSTDTDKIKKAVGGDIKTVKISSDVPNDTDMGDGVAYIKIDADSIPVAAYYEKTSVKYP